MDLYYIRRKQEGYKLKAKKIIAAAISAAMLLNVFPALTVSAEETKAVKVVNDNQQSEENREKLNFHP